MIEVLILKIENPSCFWVYIKGGGKFGENETEYKTLQDEMNLFYNTSYQRVNEVKPAVLEEGQVCAVYCQELKSWCRAVVNSIISCTDYYLVECFLVDYAKTVPVKTEKICVALESFMRLPYRAKKFSLHCTRPVTLRIDYGSDSAEIVPTNKWDIAAIHYFQNLLIAATQVKAKLCAVEEDSFYVYLYVTRKGEKVCVNDDLVAKKFACYEINKNMIRNQTAVGMESHSEETKSEENNPAFLLWPMLLQESKTSETCTAPIYNNFEKAEYTNFQETDCHDRLNESDVVVAISPLKQGITISVPDDMQAASNLHMETSEIQEVRKDPHEKNVGVKLLQFLNPDPLRTDGQETEELQLNITTHLPVVLSNKIEPCLSLERAPLSPALKKELLRNRFLGPNHVQSYSWPAIARGWDSLVISPENDPLLYLLPIIAFMQSRNCYVSLPAGNSPTTLIVCPGQKKAELVFELLEKYSLCSRPLHPILLFLGMNKEEIKSVRLPRGCEIIVTTPHCLVRLLEYHSLLFLRLCHLVFDEVDVLFSEAHEQILNVLEYYKANLNVEEKACAPQQIVAVGSHWDKNTEYLTKEFMNDPYIIITSMEEAAIYGKVQQVVQLCLDCNRISRLLQTLDFTPMNAQKTLIFTNSVKETDIVCKAVEITSIFCLKMNPEIGFHSDHILEQWNKKFSSGTHVVLVLTDDCMSAIGITDATCVIHFSFPATPRIFGARLYGMSANFQNSIEKISFLGKEQAKAKSILLLTEESSRHAVGVLDYLKRAEANISAELCNLAHKVLEAKEECKSRRPLCHSLKAYGICKIKKNCPDRHRISLQADFPSATLPSAGKVTILPLFIVDATNYFGRIIGKCSKLFAALEEEMKEYYKKSSNLVSIDIVEKLAIYGLREEDCFHRNSGPYIGPMAGMANLVLQEGACQVVRHPLSHCNVKLATGCLYVPENKSEASSDASLRKPLEFPPFSSRVQVLDVIPKEDNCVFYNVHIRYIDEGRTCCVQNNHLLSLPEQFQALPPQAVEFIVCRVKPIDNEAKWNPKVTRSINHMIRGKPHEAKIVLILGNTLWVDPVVRVTRLQDLKTSVNEYSIRSEILSTGLGVDNPEHIKELQRFLREAEVAHEKKDMPALMHSLKHGNSEKAESPNSETPKEQVLPNIQHSQTDEGVTQDSYSQVPLQNSCNEVVQNKEAVESLRPLNESFHPTIKWFEKQDVVVLKINLQNINSYDCKFYTQRITFSASAKGKFYLADMELQRSILTEKSTCVLKGDEPIVVLAKEKKEPWGNLLIKRNPHVSFDFDYLEDYDERSSFIVGSCLKKTHQVATVVYNEESSSSLEESDTESDLSSC